MRARHGLSDFLARLMVGRGVSVEEAEVWLDPRLKTLFPDPSRFADMDRAVEVLVAALQVGTPAAVFADYDVDGATASALLTRYFRAQGRELRLYVPDRLQEGYGPSPEAFARLQAQGVELIITVDCGAAAYQALAAAQELGLRVVVLDHHLMQGALPPAAALVNPNRPDDTSGCGYLAAAGVVYVLLAALNRHIREGDTGLKECDILPLLDLAAVGTICDVAPLKGLNRALVAAGLKTMARAPNLGLAMLARVAGLGQPKSSYHAGFMLGPRLNAGGRVGEAELAARLLATDDEAEALGIATRLHAFNEERKEIEARILEDAIAQVEAKLARHPDLPLAFAASEGWHPGVIGIVASRLKERFHRPSFVVGWGEGLGPTAKGSGRSVEGVNLGDAVAAVVRQGVLLSGGGHAMAAGASLAPEAVGAFEAALAAELAVPYAGAGEARTLWVDAVIGAGAATSALIAEMSRGAPYGAGSPEPVFVIPKVLVTGLKVLNGGHMRFTALDHEGGKLEAIAWRAADGPLGAALASGGMVHLAGRLSEDSWNNRHRIQLEVIDAAVL